MGELPFCWRGSGYHSLWRVSRHTFLCLGRPCIMLTQQHVALEKETERLLSTNRTRARGMKGVAESPAPLSGRKNDSVVRSSGSLKFRSTSLLSEERRAGIPGDLCRAVSKAGSPLRQRGSSSRVQQGTAWLLWVPRTWKCCGSNLGSLPCSCIVSLCGAGTPTPKPQFLLWEYQCSLVKCFQACL